MSGLAGEHARREPGRLELSDRTHLPSSSPAGEAAIAELPDDSAVHAFRTLRILLSFARGEYGATWFPSDRLRAWEEELLRSSLDVRLRAPLATIVGELVEPAAADVSLVAWSCWCVVEWATPDHSGTALEFSEAAALVWPANPRYAMLHGRLLRSHGFPREAETWLRRAALLARREGDAEVSVRATNSLGMLLWNQGNIRGGVEALVRAQRTARRAGLRTLEGEVLHDRFAVAITTGDFTSAEKFATAAFERYLPDHPRLSALAYDAAYLWLSRGYATRALPLLQALLPHFPERAPRLQVLAAISRAAGMLNDPALFASAAAEFQSLATDITDAVLAAALIDVGLGAISIGDDATARSVLVRAVDTARQRGQTDMIIRAEEALERLERGASERARGASSVNLDALTDRVLLALGRLPPSHAC